MTPARSAASITLSTFCGRHVERLFAKDVEPAADGRDRLLGVDARRRADRDDIEGTVIEEAVEIIVDRAAVRFRQTLRLLAVRAAHRRNLDTRNAERRARVRIADVAAAEDADLHAETPNLDVAEPDLVAVILQQDVAVLALAETIDALELALLDCRIERRTVELVLQHLLSVQPVLDRLAAHDDSRRVPFAGRFQRPIGSLQDIVERGRLPMRPDLRIRMSLVIDHLVLVADG